MSQQPATAPAVRDDAASAGQPDVATPGARAGAASAGQAGAANQEPAAAAAAGAAHATVRIGLTGPIGCGKSTVAGWLGELGAVVIDADTIAHQVTAPGEPALEAVIARFGEPLRLPDGSLDRAALGRRVFASPADLADLEAIVHPAVRPRILAAIAAAEASDAPAVVIEAIKLVEGRLADLCDEVWLITCTVGQQRTRLRGRGMPDPEAVRRIAAQGDLVARLRPRATRVIDTSGSSADARGRVEEALLGALRVDDGIPSVAEFRVWARQVQNASHGSPVIGPRSEDDSGCDRSPLRTRRGRADARAGWRRDRIGDPDPFPGG